MDCKEKEMVLLGLPALYDRPGTFTKIISMLSIKWYYHKHKEEE